MSVFTKKDEAAIQQCKAKLNKKLKFWVKEYREIQSSDSDEWIDILEEKLKSIEQMKRAFKKYGKKTCKEAFDYYEEGVGGANTIGIYLGLTTRQADASINAYETYDKIMKNKLIPKGS